MFYDLVATKRARKLVQNHAITIMLIFNFVHLTVDVSIIISYRHLEYVLIFNPVVCLTQQFVDDGIWYGAIFMMLWISIEQHILIFHSPLVATARGCSLFHNIPLSVFPLYPLIFYIYMIFFLSLCGADHIFTQTHLTGIVWFETLTHYTIPVSLIIVFSINFAEISLTTSCWMASTSENDPVTDVSVCCLPHLRTPFCYYSNGKLSRDLWFW
jgi:hypothetical protein